MSYFLRCLLKFETGADFLACQPVPPMEKNALIIAHLRSLSLGDVFALKGRLLPENRIMHGLIKWLTSKTIHTRRAFFPKSISFVNHRLRNGPVVSQPVLARKGREISSTASEIVLVAASGINILRVVAAQSVLTTWPRLQAHRRWHVGCSWWPSSSCLGGCDKY